MKGQIGVLVGDGFLVTYKRVRCEKALIRESEGLSQALCGFIPDFDKMIPPEHNLKSLARNACLSCQSRICQSLRFDECTKLFCVDLHDTSLFLLESTMVEL